MSYQSLKLKFRKVKNFQRHLSEKPD